MPRPYFDWEGYYMVTNRQKQLQGFQQVNINNTRQFNQVWSGLIANRIGLRK
jgi:hypothetical protein